MEPYLGELIKPGYTLFDDEGRLFWWKDCKTSGCDNQVCTWLSNSLCHPCSLRKAGDVGRKIKTLEAAE